MRAAPFLCAVLVPALGVCAPRRAAETPPPGLDLYMPRPDSHATPAAAALGRRLFMEPALSLDYSLSCASCHRPDRAMADTVAQPAGVRGRTGRNAPSLLNAGYRAAFGWSARSGSLEAHVRGALEDPAEMGITAAELVQRLGAAPGYRAAFRNAFGTGDGGAVTFDRAVRALAAYLRTLHSGGARFDRYRDGDSTALDGRERVGLRLFLGRANCVACHPGPLFTDGELHNTGVSWGTVDAGRAEWTGRDPDRGRFATPSLRDVACTAPYMHDGSLPTLEAVVAFYSAGGRPNPNLDPEVRPLHLTGRDRRALVAFLMTLTGEGGCSRR
jgi:cytochrome c peroxidase